MIGWPSVVLGLGAATAYAVSATLKHLSAGQVGETGGLNAKAVGQFVTATVTHRWWLLAVAVDVIGVALHALALRSGALAVVQPLLVSSLVIALVLRAYLTGRFPRREIAWGVVLTVSLVAFLGVANVSSGHTTTAGTRSVVVVVLAGAGAALGCVLLARRHPGRVRAAALLGLAVGTIDASTAAIIKSLTRIASGGVGAVVVSWQLYAVIVLGAGALLLNQLAFQAGPISASLPAISTADPLLSIVIGVVVFHESFRHGALALLALAVLLATLLTAVVALAKIEPAPHAVIPA